MLHLDHDGKGPAMTWCLSWWSPEGWTQALVTVVFWGALLLAGAGAFMARRRHHAAADQAGDRGATTAPAEHVTGRVR